MRSKQQNDRTSTTNGEEPTAVRPAPSQKPSPVFTTIRQKHPNGGRNPYSHNSAESTTVIRSVTLCLDKGYDSGEIRRLVEKVYGYTSHIRSRGEEKRELDRSRGEKPRRWVVERTHSWLNRFRAVLIRWEKKLENHLAALHIACAYYTLSQAGVFG